MAEFLTKGGIARIKSGDCSFHPVLQITQIQQLKGAEGAAARYRFHLTDGADKIQSMPATQLNPAILEGKLQQYSIIKIVNFQTSNVNGHIIVILLGYEPVAQLNYEVPSRDSAPPPQYAAPIAAAPSSLYHPTYGTTTSNPSNAPITPAQPPAHPAYPSHPSTAPSHQPYANVPSYGTTSVPGNAAYPPRAPVAAAPTNPYGSYGSSSSSKPVMKDDAAMSANVVPISAINPYSSKWTIKARITAKSDIRKWSNARGEGTLFSIDLLDSHGGEIRGTFFKDACEKFYPMLQEGKVYTFSGGTLKVVQNKQYSHLKNNYEITFNQNSEIIAVHDDAGIKSQVFNFVKINAIAMTETNATIDIIAVVRAATEVSEIVSTKQGGRTLLKRDLTLIDESGTEIKLTLWGDKASTPYDWSSSPIAAFKNVRVGDYGGKSLSSSASTTITLNPLIPEGEALHKWKVSFGGAVPSGTSLSGGASQGGGLDSFDRRKLIASIRDEGLGLNTEKPDYITIKGTIVYIKHDTEPFYSACPTPGCNKKVTETMNGEFHCEKCNKTFPTCIRRYILSVSMADHSGSNWFTLFNDTADILLKAKAQDLHELKVQGDEAGYEKIFSDALFKTVVGKVRVKQESMNNEEMRVKSSFMKVEEVDFIAESRNLLDAINKYQ